MADHREEQILARVVTLVTGLTTTALRIDRGREDEIASENTPALRVRGGDDIVADPWAHALLDSELDVIVEAKVYDSAANVETKLIQIRKEVSIALLADHTLGLAFVEGIVELGARKPLLSSESAKPSGSRDLMFRVKYRRSRTDPSA